MFAGLFYLDVAARGEHKVPRLVLSARLGAALGMTV